VVAAFVVMEPITALVHRIVMHGWGWRLHVSHHRAGAGRLQANDLYPLVFASLTMLVMALGFQWKGQDVLVPATAGVSGYGLCYGFVHEVYIHRRLPFPWQVGLLERLREAHRIHHRWSGAPFGMLVPVVPRRLRDRAAGRAGARDPVGSDDRSVTLV